MIAAVKIRGTVDARKKARQSLQHLGLKQKNQVVFLEETDANRGQLSVAKDYITFGEITEETVEKVEEEKDVEIDAGTTVNLRPPSGGFKDTRKQVGQGGSLGRREDMEKLLTRMI
ncbi:MAG: uL30 family ribosomal protein [Candidatus Nanohalobium sp.]